jgi:DNA-binding transcriptional LysR family regulator
MDAGEHAHDWSTQLQAMRLASAILEAGSITGAARLLGYSQPAISQQLSRTERLLGLAIVTRVGRSIRLTETGALLAARWGVVETELVATFDAVHDLGAGIKGRVRIAAFPSASSSIAPALLDAMRRRYGGIDVQFVEEEPPEAAAMLAAGTVDLALVFSYPDDLTDGHAATVRNLEATTLFAEPVYVVLRDDHPLASGDRVAMSALSDSDWIAGCPRCRGHLLELCRAAGFEPRLTRETDHTIAVIGMVRAGLGVGMLPSIALASMGLPPDVRLLPTEPASPRVVHAVTAVGGRRVPAVAAAFEVLADVVVELGLTSPQPAPSR